MELRPPDKSYGSNLSNNINGSSNNWLLLNAVLESQPSDENLAPSSRIRNVRKPHPKTSKMPDVTLWRSQQLIAEQKSIKRPAQIDDVLDLTVKKRKIDVPSPTTDENEELADVSGNSYDDANDSDEKSMAYDLLYKNESAPLAYNCSTQEEAVCLTKLAKTPDAAEETRSKKPSSSNSSSIKIDIDGVIHETFQSTAMQTQQIDLYKIEHKITTNPTATDDDLYIEIGPLGTLVPFNEFKKIAWTEARQATHELLSLVFPLHVLETHVLSQRFTPFELSALSDQSITKPRLNDKKVYDVLYCVIKKTKMSKAAFEFIAAKRLAELAKAKAKVNDNKRKLI